MIHIFNRIPRRNMLLCQVLSSGCEPIISNILRAYIRARLKKSNSFSKYFKYSFGREKITMGFFILVILCVKSVPYWEFFWSVFSRIWTEYGET